MPWRIIVILLFVFSTGSLQAKEIALVAGLSLPPYIIAETGNGMEHDIVKEVLQSSGYVLKLKYVPFARVVHDYKKYDGAVTVNEATGVKGYFSDVVIAYQNYAITLKDCGIIVDDVQDLAGKRVAAFQNATSYLGDEYKRAVLAADNYMELDKQISQVEMLYSRRIDVVISDINIFKFYRTKVTRVDTASAPEFHEIFAPTLYKVVFNEADVREAFNRGLADLKACGRYQQIIDTYIKKSPPK